MNTTASRTDGRHRQFTSIRFLLLLLVVATALPPLTFAFIKSREAHRAEQRKVQSFALQLAQRVASQVDAHVNVVDATLITLSRGLRTDGNGKAHNDSLLASVSRDLGPRFLSLSVADTLGRVIGLARGGTSATVADRTYFREAMKSRRLAVGDPMIGRVTGKYAIAVSRAIIGPDGRVQGVATASTTLQHLHEIMVVRDLPPGAVVTMVNRQGVVLAQSGSAQSALGRDVSNFASIQESLREGEGARELSWIDGSVRFSGFTRAASVPWHIYVGIPRDVALRDAERASRETLWLGLGSLLLSLGLAWLIASRIAGPVRALTADAEVFAQGNLSHRSGVGVAGELGQLAETFNRMAEALQRQRADLTASELRYRNLFDTTPLPMWVYDVESLRFLAVNQTAVDRYGYSRDQFLAMTVDQIRPAEELPRMHDFLNKSAVRRAQSTGWRHLTSSGELLDVEISSNELDDGHARARIVVVTDVTERRRTEDALRVSQEQLRQSQKMEAVGSLAGGIAHDFNNLLTAILGYCDLALESVTPGSTAAEDVEEIRRAAERAAELTRQLLTFSRQQVLNPRVFAINDAVERTHKIIRRLISENITVVHALANPAPLVSADAAQVEQVLMNLAVNARDAMPRGGVLTVSTTTRTFDAPHPVAGGTLPPGEYTVLTVHDTGKGISSDVRERLFEPFFTTKARGQGTGLGLATVYGVMRQSGGGVDVESGPDRGTVFSVYFPSASAEPGGIAEPAASPLVTARGEGTILLAEDDDAVRAIARATLQRAGYTVLAARDGPDAIRIAAAHDGQIDLLLTDVIMPGMNGRELAEQLTAKAPGLAVLFASGYTGNVLADLGLSLPGVQLLDKPFTPAVLTSMVASVLETARADVAP